MKPSITKHPLAFLLATLFLAQWPVWMWYGNRMMDGSDEPYGILALAAGFCLVWRDRANLRLSERNAIAATILLILHAVAMPFLPGLVSALFAIGILAVACGSWRRNPGVWAVFALSLPLIASMQFYLGYPMRWLGAVAGSGILQTFGLEVERAGTNLLWNGNVVGVDPPCSGVEMLWVGMFLVALFAAFRRYRFCRFAIFMIAGAGAIVAANCLRVALLFIKESGMMNLPAWTHEGIGILIFTGLVLIAEKWFPEEEAPAVSEPETNHPNSLPKKTFYGGLIAVTLSASVLPALLGGNLTGNDATHPFPGWPVEWEGRYLESLPLTEAEESFASQFPGKIGVFSNGPDKIILRWVTRPTRKLHSAADCLRAEGYHIETERSGSFVAANETGAYRIDEQITNESGRWDGVSQWFWAASLGKTEGPWWASTVIRPIN